MKKCMKEKYISQMSIEELSAMLDAKEQELKEYCNTEEYVWYVDNKDLKKENFEDYRDYQKWLRRSNRNSVKYHGLRSIIDYLEFEINVRSQADTKRPPVRVVE